MHMRVPHSSSQVGVYAQVVVHETTALPRERQLVLRSPLHEEVCQAQVPISVWFEELEGVFNSLGLIRDHRQTVTHSHGVDSTGLRQVLKNRRCGYIVFDQGDNILQAEFLEALRSHGK